MTRRRPTRRTFGVAVTALLLASACATRSFRPAELDSVPLRLRAQVQRDGEVEVRAAVPGLDETRALFGVALYDRGIQPVWLEVANGQGDPVRFAPVGVDRTYFSPIEVAYIHRGGFSKADRSRMERRYSEMAMPRSIPAGESRSGFVFTHLDPGTKGFTVDIFAETTDHHFTFFIQVPGLEPDYTAVDFDALYDESRIQRLDEAGLRSALEALPCCTTVPGGDGPGTPLNVVLVAEGEDLLQSLLRSRWKETALDASHSVFEVKPHWDGRPADAVFRTERRGRAAGGDLRLWVTPLRVRGTRVWMGQVTKHVGTFLGISRLDPDVDDARSYLMQTFWYGQSLARYAWLDGDYPTPIASSAWDPFADRWFSDGYRLVLWLSGPAVALSETEYLEWDEPPAR